MRMVRKRNQEENTIPWARESKKGFMVGKWCERNMSNPEENDMIKMEGWKKLFP